MKSIEEVNKFYREIEQLSLNAVLDEESFGAYRGKLLSDQIKVAPPTVDLDYRSLFRSVGDLLRNAMRTIDDEIRPTRKAKQRS